MSNTEKPYPDLEITLIKLELEARLHGDLREEEWEDLRMITMLISFLMAPSLVAKWQIRSVVAGRSMVKAT